MPRRNSVRGRDANPGANAPGRAIGRARLRVGLREIGMRPRENAAAGGMAAAERDDTHATGIIWRASGTNGSERTAGRPKLDSRDGRNLHALRLSRPGPTPRRSRAAGIVFPLRLRLTMHRSAWPRRVLRRV